MGNKTTHRNTRESRRHQDSGNIKYTLIMKITKTEPKLTVRI